MNDKMKTMKYVGSLLYKTSPAAQIKKVNGKLIIVVSKISDKTKNRIAKTKKYFITFGK